MNQLFDISGKVIVVTGATGILAGGAAKYLQRNGAKVIYLGRNQERVDRAIQDAREISDDCMGLTCDVLDENGLKKGYEDVLNRFGQIDALINGAGGNMPGATIGPDKEIFDLDLDDYTKVMDLNLKGTVIPTLAFAQAFKEQKSGCVINFSSMSSTQALTRVLGYSNAKAAIDNFTRWMAMNAAINSLISERPYPLWAPNGFSAATSFGSRVSLPSESTAAPGGRLLPSLLSC